jgi:hypothetical protein
MSIEDQCQDMESTLSLTDTTNSARTVPRIPYQKRKPTGISCSSTILATLAKDHFDVDAVAPKNALHDCKDTFLALSAPCRSFGPGVDSTCTVPGRRDGNNSLFPVSQRVADVSPALRRGSGSDGAEDVE